MASGAARCFGLLGQCRGSLRESLIYWNSVIPVAAVMRRYSVACTCIHHRNSVAHIIVILIGKNVII
ncbi:Hypothetical protein SMAX5B_014130 [Scophthalmus maximus]|uniref:Uncharacterized protein n=1 Tax=Scophthalmus maximus TaxID=52904 RepID=A0A2U9BHE3_SCOMX|nr:Hypothetical protein SMAX5B_014130 [Scophthalmus maximus]